MANGLYVSPEDMNEQGRQTREEAVQLSNEIKNLQNTKASLLDIWKGTAANSFGESVDRQIDNLNQFKELINELGEAISSGAQGLSETEEANASAGKNLFDE